MEIGSFFNKECQKLHRFLNANAKENGTFRSELTGETFTSLRQKVDNFTSIDLEKYDSYVLQSGLSKNRERYISKLEYQNFLNNISYQKLMAEYQNRLHTIEIYDSALTAVVLIPTLTPRTTSICPAPRSPSTTRPRQPRAPTTPPTIRWPSSRKTNTPSAR